MSQKEFLDFLCDKVTDLDRHFPSECLDDYIDELCKEIYINLGIPYDPLIRYVSIEDED